MWVNIAKTGACSAIVTHVKLLSSVINRAIFETNPATSSPRCLKKTRDAYMYCIVLSPHQIDTSTPIAIQYVNTRYIYSDYACINTIVRSSRPGLGKKVVPFPNDDATNISSWKAGFAETFSRLSVNTLPVYFGDYASVLRHGCL